jgi:hypothetical protein
MMLLFRSGGRRGEYNSIIAMKRYITIEYIHSNVFPGQGKDKVNIFKMLVDKPRSGMDLVKHMQPRRDFKSVWLLLTMSSMFKNRPQWLVICTMQRIARS